MVKLESMKLWASCRPEVLNPSANTFTTPCGVTRMIRPPKVFAVVLPPVVIGTRGLFTGS